MRAGPLDRRVILQRKTLSYSDSGQPIETWAAVGGERWASRNAIAGEERFTSETLNAKEQVEFRIRWSSDLAELQPTDRLIEPSDDATISPIPPRSIYDIIGVLEIGRREGLRVQTTRRVDTITS